MMMINVFYLPKEGSTSAWGVATTCGVREMPVSCCKTTRVVDFDSSSFKPPGREISDLLCRFFYVMHLVRPYLLLFGL
jgi:hypothetical protein